MPEGETFWLIFVYVCKMHYNGKKMDDGRRETNIQKIALLGGVSGRR